MSKKRQDAEGNDIVLSKNSVNILSAETSDIDEWMKLVAIVADDFPGLDKLEYEKVLLESIHNKTALCAKSQNRIIGILLFSLDNNTLSFIAVHPDFREKDIASKLIGEMLKNFSQNQKVWVTTYRDGDGKGTAARLLYKKLGFVEDELVEEFGYPCQKFVFSCDKRNR